MAEPAQPEPQPEQPAAESAQPEPQPEQPVAEPEVVEQTTEEPVAEPKDTPKPDSEQMQALLKEVQSQLAELQSKYEAELKAKEAAEAQNRTESTDTQE